MNIIASILKFLTGIIAGAAVAIIVWHTLALDDAELKHGKSPHSGFCPATPNPKQ